MNFLFFYLIAINVFTFSLMGVDKNLARNRLWRVSERALFLGSLLGGSAGTWLGMYLFRHKTRKKRFVIGIPVILLIQSAILLWLLLK
jgi:uncharacterized membrane protein YsdA (DUF1294 family)